MWKSQGTWWLFFTYSPNDCLDLQTNNINHLHFNLKKNTDSDYPTCQSCYLLRWWVGLPHCGVKWFHLEESWAWWRFLAGERVEYSDMIPELSPAKTSKHFFFLWKCSHTAWTLVPKMLCIYDFHTSENQTLDLTLHCHVHVIEHKISCQPN